MIAGKLSTQVEWTSKQGFVRLQNELNVVSLDLRPTIGAFVVQNRPILSIIFTFTCRC